MVRRKVDELAFPDGQRVAVWAERMGKDEPGVRLILRKDMPMPWAEWFFRGFIGACPVLEDGTQSIYLHDVTRFIRLWKAGKWRKRVSGARVS